MPLLPLRPVLAALAAALALALSGCGSGPSATVAASQKVTIAMSEFRLVPQRLTVAAGRRAFVVRNAGTVVHRFEILPKDGGKPIVLGRPMTPGEQQTLLVTLPSGSYLMRCAQERHNTLGEWGTIEVRGV
jgi:uncharacterized cupredoxin-like copper-binding protein